MKNYVRHATVTKIEKADFIAAKVVKKWFGKRRAFVDKFHGMRYAKYGTYAENKQDYYNTLGLVYSGKYPTIFDAYAATHS